MNRPVLIRLAIPLLVHGRFDREGKPGRIWLEYDHSAFYQAQNAASLEKRITVNDRAGRPVSFTFRWTKVKDEKAHNGYRAAWVDIAPPTPQRGAEYAHDFEADGDGAVRMMLAY